MQYRVAGVCVLASGIAASASAGLSVSPRAGGFGEGIARTAIGRIVQDSDRLDFMYPTTGVGYQRAEVVTQLGNAGGFAGGAGLANARPRSGLLSMSTGTRTEINSGSGQTLGDAEAQAWYDDTFHVRSDTLAVGTIVPITFKVALSTLDSSNHDATTGSTGDNNARNNGTITVRVRTDAASQNSFDSVSTLARGRNATMAATTGLFFEDDEDDNDDTNYGEQIISLQAVVGSTITLETLFVATTTSRARFVTEGNTGFCGSLLFGFDVEGGFLESTLLDGDPVPGTALVTRERAELEIPPGPTFVIPAPSSLAPLAMMMLVSRRRR